MSLRNRLERLEGLLGREELACPGCGGIRAESKPTLVIDASEEHLISRCPLCALWLDQRGVALGTLNGDGSVLPGFPVILHPRSSKDPARPELEK